MYSLSHQQHLPTRHAAVISNERDVEVPIVFYTTYDEDDNNSVVLFDVDDDTSSHDCYGGDGSHSSSSDCIDWSSCSGSYDDDDDEDHSEELFPSTELVILRKMMMLNMNKKRRNSTKGGGINTTTITSDESKTSPSPDIMKVVPTPDAMVAPSWKPKQCLKNQRHSSFSKYIIPSHPPLPKRGASNVTAIETIPTSLLTRIRQADSVGFDNLSIPSSSGHTASTTTSSVMTDSTSNFNVTSTSPSTTTSRRKSWSLRQQQLEQPHNHLLSILQKQKKEEGRHKYKKNNTGKTAAGRTDTFFKVMTQENITAYTMDRLDAIRADDPIALKKSSVNSTLQCCNQYGESIIHMACRRGAINCLKYMMSKDGGNVSLNIQDDYGRNVLHDACWTTTLHYGVIELIITHCPELLLIADKRGYYPLQYIRNTDDWSEMNQFLDKHKTTLKSLIHSQFYKQLKISSTAAVSGALMSSSSPTTFKEGHQQSQNLFHERRSKASNTTKGRPSKNNKKSFMRKLSKFGSVFIKGWVRDS